MGRGCVEQLVKPWDTAAAWQLQIGPMWSIPDSLSLFQTVQVMRSSGMLVTLNEPKLRLATGGRPREKKVDSVTAARAKQFMEDVKSGLDEAKCTLKQVWPFDLLGPNLTGSPAKHALIQVTSSNPNHTCLTFFSQAGGGGCDGEEPGRSRHKEDVP